MLVLSGGASDLWLVVDYLHQHYLSCFWPAILLVLLPSLLSQSLSLCWVVTDHSASPPRGNHICCHLCAWILQK